MSRSQLLFSFVNAFLALLTALGTVSSAYFATIAIERSDNATLINKEAIQNQRQANELFEKASKEANRLQQEANAIYQRYVDLSLPNVRISSSPFRSLNAQGCVHRSTAGYQKPYRVYYDIDNEVSFLNAGGRASVLVSVEAQSETLSRTTEGSWKVRVYDNNKQARLPIDIPPGSRTLTFKAWDFQWDDSSAQALSKYRKLATGVSGSPIKLKWIFRFFPDGEVVSETEVVRVWETNLDADCSDVDRRLTG